MTLLLISSTLAGCGLEIAEQRYASMKPMLARQAPPSCEFRRGSNDKAGGRQVSGRPAAADSDPEAARAKLDYERQCYRHAEMIARNRLHHLQRAVESTAKAVKAAATTKAEAAPPP